MHSKVHNSIVIFCLLGMMIFIANHIYRVSSTTYCRPFEIGTFFDQTSEIYMSWLLLVLWIIVVYDKPSETIILSHCHGTGDVRKLPINISDILLRDLNDMYYDSLMYLSRLFSITYSNVLLVIIDDKQGHYWNFQLTFRRETH